MQRNKIMKRKNNIINNYKNKLTFAIILLAHQKIKI